MSRAQSGRAGAAEGARLLKESPKLLLAAYCNRPVRGCPSPFADAWDVLVAALGPLADDDTVRDALHALDRAHGEALANTEDEAWYAAWTVRGGLR